VKIFNYALNMKFGLSGVMVAFILAAFSSFAQSTEGWNGNLDGVKSWELPDTENGLKPNQSWHATGSAPNGNIYVGGMDHVSNSALYRLDSTGLLRYVGDARSASEAVNNWKPDDMVEKFHTRPTWHNGRMYVANMNRSYSNDEYLTVRGFHWYAYDIAGDRFLDLSVDEPGGTAVEHGGIVTLRIDPWKNVIYGAQEPHARLYMFDIDQIKTTDLGRPIGLTQQYAYSPRVMWIDSRSRLYYTMGKAWYFNDNTAVTDHIHYYEPGLGWGELHDWKLASPVVGGKYDAIETGQWTRDRKSFFMADDRMRIYRFDDEGPEWTFLGRAAYGGSETWVFHLSADGKTIYFVPSDPAEGLFEFDTETRQTRKLCNLGQLDDDVGAVSRHTGYDAWDREGSFYFTSFIRDGGQNVILTGVNPVHVKVALGMLPELVEVWVQGLPEAPKTIVVNRTDGNIDEDLEVLYEVTGIGTTGGTGKKYIGELTIPAGFSSDTVSLDELPVPDSISAEGVVFSVVPDGNDYITSDPRQFIIAPVLRSSPLHHKRSEKEDMIMYHHYDPHGQILFHFTVPAGHVAPLPIIQLTISDLSGKQIKHINHPVSSFGVQTISWKGETNKGCRAPRGIYVVRLRDGSNANGRSIFTHVLWND
jgi:hypothetical protein